MKILHELLASEKNLVTGVNKILLETLQKFDKDHFFKGYVKTLKMLKDSTNNEQLELAGCESKELVTTVKSTLDYLMKFWCQSEDLQATKNNSNRNAVADLVVDDKILISAIPVDELMGLESRLTELRKVFEKMPTLDASKKWVRSTVAEAAWESFEDDVTTKTEKVVTPIVLYEATKEHPAQVKELSKDEVIGTFRTKHFSGAITSLQKAQVLERVDVLLVAVKRARMRANTVELSPMFVGQVLTDFMLAPLKD